MGHVAITTHRHPSNDRAGYKSQLSERHPATIQIVVKKLASHIKAYHRTMAEPVKKG